MSTLPMPFKKLHPHLQEMFEQYEITTPTAFQSKSIPVIKSGANIFCTAPKDSGKTMTLILTTLQKIKCEAVGKAPRAFVILENMEKASELYDAFLKFTRYSSIRVYLADEKVHVDLLKSEIFEGVDILISTPKAIDKLLLLNGVNTTQLKMFSIDDAEFLAHKNSYSTILSITQSITKCQFVVYSEKLLPSIKRLESYFMEYSRILSL
jgi:superfamily II DNA/RNA helicase